MKLLQRSTDHKVVGSIPGSSSLHTTAHTYKNDGVGD